MTALVTRFAPSPTGYLHVGGARTALFNWLLARRTGSDARYLLRIEDTDLARSTEQATLQLLEDLRWLGLDWDNSELIYQSRRLDVYNRLIDTLIARGLAYKSFVSQAEIDTLRRDFEKKKAGSFAYRGQPLSADEQAKAEAEGKPHVVRFIMPVKDYVFVDAVLGTITVPADEADHFVIRKSDGMPTYHFAVVVDDEEMGVTDVLRGQEHTKNTAKHLALQEALGFRTPTYAHLSTIQNLDGSKMGKRDRDKAVRQRAQEWLKSSKKTADQLEHAAGLAVGRVTEWIGDNKKQLDISEQSAVMHVIGLPQSALPEVLIHDFRKNGYLPETLLNFVALLGWSPGGDREHMSTAEMVERFSMDRVGRANPKFDRVKLLSFNTDAVAAASPERLVAAFRDYLSVNPDSPLGGATDEQLGKLLAMKKGFRLLREVDDISRFFFAADDAITYDADAVEKNLKKNDGAGLAVLRGVREVLGTVTHWTAAGCEGAVKIFCEQKGLGLGKVAQPVRVAISGTTISPPIFESLEFLGRDRTLARIDRCIAIAGGHQQTSA